MAEIIPFRGSARSLKPNSDEQRFAPLARGKVPNDQPTFPTWTEAFQATKWMRLEMQEHWFFVMTDGLPQDKDVLVIITTRLYEAVTKLSRYFGSENLRQLNGVQIFFSAGTLYWGRVGSSKQLCLHIPNDGTEDEIEASIRERLREVVAN